MADDKKIIFSMVGVSKVFPPQKQVLKNIYLSFFYGAKIGIIGLNGSGKSTLLKIIAGVEKEYQGEVVFSPGYSVGYLEQEPKLEPGKTVKEVVQEGVQNIVDTLKEYEEVNEKFGDPEILEDPDKMDALINRQAELQDKIDATDAWNLDSRLERAMDALRCPPEDQVVDTLSGGERRRVALCRTSCCWTNRPTTWMLSRSTGWSNIYNNIRVRLSASRTTVTSSTMWPDGFWNWIAEKVFPGKETTLLGWIKRLNVWHRRRNKQVNAVRHWNAN